MVLVLTGGTLAGKPESEAVAMRRYLEETHVSVKEWQLEGRLEIVLETASQNTAENAYLSKSLLLKRLKQIVEVANVEGDLERYLVGCTVITSDFHVPRSSLIFNQVFNTVYDLTDERQGLKTLRREQEKSGLWPPPTSQFLFDLSFVGPPTPKEHTNPSEASFIKSCPEYLAMYESRYPTGDLPSRPQSTSPS